jgi:filamentous hemagglutinin family protein
MSDGIRSHWPGPLLFAALLAAGPAHAQIVTDGTVGPAVSLSGPNVDIGAHLGTQRGDNLFHSFEKFGIATGQTATFRGPDTIKNVISRVTSGEISNIDGKLASKVGQADLYFINPAGVMFGPNAKLDVPGSLHVSTAHELRFADGARFSAIDKTGSGLTVAPPEAFGFLDRSLGRISVEHSKLQLPPGKAFSLVGGDIDIAGGSSGSLAAPGGTVTLTSLTGTGQSRISDGVVDAARQGTIRLTDQAQITTSGNGGGMVRIRGGTLTVEQSTMAADNTGERNSTGGIDLFAGLLSIENSRVSTEAQSSGRGGTMIVRADEMVVRNTNTTVTASPRGMHSDTNSRGDAGLVNVQADRLFISGPDAVITSDARTNSTGGNAGTVNIQADRLIIRGDGSLYTTAISSSTHSTGTSGTVTVTARELELHDGGVIHGTSFGFGRAGTVIVQAGRLLISGWPASIQSGTTSSIGSAGSAGSVTVTADTLDLRDGGNIQAITQGSGDAGTVSVWANHLFASSNDLQHTTGILGLTLTHILFG